VGGTLHVGKRLRRDPISPMRNGGKNARGKCFFPLDPFLWWCETCFSASAGQPWRATGWRAGTWDETCAAACPAGGHAVTHLGQRAAGQVMQRGCLTRSAPTSTGSRAEPWCSFSRLSPEKAGPCRRHSNNAAGYAHVKKRNGASAPFLFVTLSRTCSPAPPAGHTDGCRPHGRGRSCGGGPP